LSTLDIIFSNNVKTMELQTGDLPGWDRPPAAFTKIGVVSQFATFTTYRRLQNLLLTVPFANLITSS